MKKKLMICLVAVLLLASTAWTQGIFEAITAGNLDEVKSLLTQTPALIETTDSTTCTPLLAAALAGQEDIVHYLVDNKADITAVNRRGSTALILAASEGHAAIVEYLIGLGADINAATNTGITPLMFAAYQSRPEVAEILLKAGADKTLTDGQWGGAALHWGCSRGNRAVLEILVAGGFDLNLPSATDSSTPIFWAANSGNEEALQFMIDKGVDPASTMANGWTTLHVAAQKGQFEAVKLLIEAGADINAVDEDGNTPFSVAFWGRNLDLIAYFLDHGVDINEANENGMTALHFAAIQGIPDMVRLLLERNIDVNAVDSFNTTAFDRAVGGGNLEIIKLLIDRASDLNRPNYQDMTPVMNAAQGGNADILRLLLDRGAKIDHRDTHYGRTALHFAALKGSPEIAQMLIDNGADINAADNEGHTPLYYAGRYGFAAVTAMLKQHQAISDANEDNFGYSPLLKEKLSEGDAAVWYLGHCGFAFKTASHLLIFDYWTRGSIPGDPLLANGYINPDELAGQDVYVFVSHEHQDHYDTAIFALKDQLDNITYIYGFKPEEIRENSETGYTGPAYEYIGPREQKTIGGMDIATIEANDAGVGFLIDVDGVSIYFAGDHAGWREGERDGYMAEIDYLAQKVSNVDFALINVTGCHTHDTLALVESVAYALDKLAPSRWFPTHGIDREYVYDEFMKKPQIEALKVKSICPDHRGDHYLIKKDDLL